MSWPPSAAAAMAASRYKASVSKSRPSISKMTARAWRGSFMVGRLFPLVDGCRSRRRLRHGVLAGEQMDQRALDRGLPGRRVDLGAEQIGDIEHVAGAFAEGRDMRRGDIEVEFRDRRGQFVQQARP